MDPQHCLFLILYFTPISMAQAAPLRECPSMVVDRLRADADPDPDPTFSFDTVPDPDPTPNFNTC
jgi:hypothetical protein